MQLANAKAAVDARKQAEAAKKLEKEMAEWQKARQTLVKNQGTMLTPAQRAANTSAGTATTSAVTAADASQTTTTNDNGDVYEYKSDTESSDDEPSKQTSTNSPTSPTYQLQGQYLQALEEAKASANASLSAPFPFDTAKGSPTYMCRDDDDSAFLDRLNESQREELIYARHEAYKTWDLKKRAAKEAAAKAAAVVAKSAN